MAFTYHDQATGKAIHDIATADLVGRSADGKTIVKIFENGALAGMTAPYTDAKAVAAVRKDAKITALAPSAAADVAALVVDLNKVIAALKGA